MTMRRIIRRRHHRLWKSLRNHVNLTHRTATPWYILANYLRCVKNQQPNPQNPRSAHSFVSPTHQANDICAPSSSAPLSLDRPYPSLSWSTNPNRHPTIHKPRVHSSRTTIILPYTTSPNTYRVPTSRCTNHQDQLHHITIPSHPPISSH